jgi:hypothetical protein
MKAILFTMSALIGPMALLIAQPPAPAPTVTMSLGSRQAQAVPSRQGFTHTGGGNIDVAQQAPDAVVVTMTGVAVAGKHPLKESLATLSFDLVQAFANFSPSAGGPVTLPLTSLSMFGDAHLVGTDSCRFAK